MKKLILMVASLMIASPINAESFNEIVNSRSYTLKCMIYRKCKDGVKPINDISDIASSYPDSNFNIVADEFNRMLTSLKTIGVEVFLGDERYFPKKYRGVYSSRKNNISIKGGMARFNCSSYSRVSSCCYSVKVTFIKI